MAQNLIKDASTDMASLVACGPCSLGLESAAVTLHMATAKTDAVDLCPMLVWLKSRLLGVRDIRLHYALRTWGTRAYSNLIGVDYASCYVSTFLRISKHSKFLDPV